MEIETKIKLIENLTWIISLIIAIIAIISISLIGWIAGFVLLGMAIIVIAVFLDKDIIFPAFIIIVTSTSQIPEQYHHLISYGFSFLLLGFWLFRHIRSNTQLLEIDRGVSLFIFAVLLLSFVSSVFSDYYRQGLFATFRLAFFFVIVYVLYDWLRSEVQIRKVFSALVIIGLVISFPAIIQFAQAGFTLFSSSLISPTRFAGFFTGQGALAMNLSYTLPITLSMSLYSKNSTARFFLFTSFLIMSFALFLTFSRAAWISVAISTTILILTTRKGKQFIIILTILLTSIMLSSEMIQEMLLILLRIESGLSSRDVMWKAAWDIFKDHPIIGTGPWTFREYAFSYTRVEPGSWISGIVSFSKGSAHNFYLHSAAELGFGGFLMSTGIFILYFRKFHLIKKLTQSSFNYLLYPCGAIVAGVIGRSFFQANGIITSGWLSMDLYFWVIFSITLSIGKFGTAKLHEKSFPPALDNQQDKI